MLSKSGHLRVIQDSTGFFDSTLMVDGRDIWRAANLLIKRYADDAAIQAAQRADELFNSGDSDGYAI